tara:strand:- start:171 stop:536 length:366 start_codon:yes stop_codon:yes gene_type:complete
MSKIPFFDDRERILENSIGFVIYDKFPVSKGHCLVVPKRKYSDYFESSKKEIKGLNDLLFEAKKILDIKFQPAGYNVGVNCGSVSGQTINHLHIHLIPRYLNDVKDPSGGVRGVIPGKQKY